MNKARLKIFTAFLLTCVLNYSVTTAQSADTNLIRLVTLEKTFVTKIKTFGFTPSLFTPQIVIDNPPSWGNYNDTFNVLHSSIWEPQPNDTKSFFESLAQQLGNGETGEDVFNKAAHQWIFIHEMGHWWRACKKIDTTYYEEETGANRIAIAWWREQDPKFMAFMMTIFNSVVNSMPSPIPAGQTEQSYFNNNYTSLAGTAAYSWYQSKMIVNVYNEKPILSFKQAIINAGYLK